MAEKVAKGTLVEIRSIVLEAGKRAPQVPDETQQVPLEMRAKGLLEESASIGSDAVIITPVGRRLHGTLISVNPPHTHSFGPPIPELYSIGNEVRAILRERGSLK
jgi:hypothetical protein